MDKIILKEVAVLKPYKNNAKKHTAEQIKKVADSIRAFGFNQPLVIDADGVVIVGHGRLEAAKLLKMTEVPCVVADSLSKQQVKAYRLADNKLNESDWNMDLVLPEIESLSLELIKLTGFDEELLIEPEKEKKEVQIKSLFQVVVDCRDELEQEKIYNQLKDFGFNPKIVNF